MGIPSIGDFVDLCQHFLLLEIPNLVGGFKHEFYFP
jgi:hypothetical protein